jgi:hypothetical protein
MAKKNNTLAGFFDFVGSKIGFYPWQINYTQKPIFLLTKSMQRLPI